MTGREKAAAAKAHRFGIAVVASRICASINRLRRGLSLTRDVLSPPQADQIAAVLDVEKRAAVDGGSDQPPTSEEILDGTQRQIVDYHRNLQDKARRKVERLAARIAAAARRIDLPEHIDELRDVSSKCRNRVDRVTAEFRSELDLMREGEALARRSLDDTGDQDTESGSGQHALRAVYFVLMLAITGVVSLALGSKSVWGVDSVSLLPMGSAAVIAVIGIVLPFMIAATVSGRPADQFERKRLTFWAVVAVTFLHVGFLAFFCAHLVVESAGASLSDGSDVATALTAMSTNPGVIATDIDALKALFIVIATGLLAFLLGSQFGSIDGEEGGTQNNPYLRARRRREQLAALLRRRINGIVDAAEKDVTRSSTRVKSRVKKLAGLVNLAQDVDARYRDYLTGLEESCNLLLERYREANAAARSSEIPFSFAEQVCFRLDGASEPSVFEEGIEQHRQVYSQMLQYGDVVAKVRHELRDLNRDAIRDLGAVDVAIDDARDHDVPQSAY